MTDKEKLERAYALGSPGEVKALYRDWAATYDTDFAEAGGYRMPGLIADAYVALGGRSPVLDAGCGTGLVADCLPGGFDIHGIDISAEMLDIALGKERYIALFELDLAQSLPFKDGVYNGLVSAGTFTHGHVGPEVLGELFRCLAPGAAAAIGTNAGYMAATGFRDVLDAHVAAGRITDLALRGERIYARPEGAPDGHGDDMGFVITFRRI